MPCGASARIYMPACLQTDYCIRNPHSVSQSTLFGKLPKRYMTKKDTYLTNDKDPTSTGLSSLPITIDADWTVRKFKELIASQVGLTLQEMILLQPQGQGGAAGARVELTINDEGPMLRQIKDMNLNAIRVEKRRPAERDVNIEVHRVTISMFMFHRGQGAAILQRLNWLADIKISGNQANNKAAGRGAQFNLCMTPDSSNRAIDATIRDNEILEEANQYNVYGQASPVVDWSKSRSATDDTRR